MSWLRGTAAQTYSPAEVRSYAFYVLAKQGQINLSDLRYFHDTDLHKIKTPLAAAHLGAALAELGDRARAHSAFDRAVALTAKPMADKVIPPYGSDLRDPRRRHRARRKEGEVGYLPVLFDRMSVLKSDIEWTSTQEKAWMLLAANALSVSQGPLKFDVKGVATNGKNPVYLPSLKPGQTEGVEVRNAGDKSVWYTVAVEGIPIAPLPADSKGGVTITKQYFTMDGHPADLAHLKQSDKVIVVISGKMPDMALRTMGVMDLLPAGLEIESPLVPGAEKAYPFLPALTDTSLQQKRDDRYIAAFTLSGTTRSTPQGIVKIIPNYAVAYIARAISPGQFVNPASTVEDMYAPGVKARTDVGAVTVGGGGQ